ncbi:MAG: MFS transporter [Prosthecobacter sp.]|nr:MFS transporter [Prosthecobacter sp.]
MSASSRAWLVVALLCVVACLNYLDRVMLTTMRESVKEAIPMTDAQFGLLTSVFLWVYGALSPFAGFLADRLSRSRVIIGSLFLWSVTTWLTSHAVTFDQLLITRAIMGLSEACYLPAALALISDYHRGPTRSLAIGIHNCGVSIGAGLGGMGGWLAERHGWSFAFGLFGIIGIVYSFLLIFGLRDAPPGPLVTAVPPEKPSFLPALKSLFGQGGFLVLLVHWGLMGLASWGIVGWMPTYLQQQFHLGQGEAGFSATAYLQVSTLFGLIMGGVLADRWSRSRERGRIFIAIIGMCIAAPAIFLTANTQTFVIAIAGLVIFGFARAWTDGNTMPILCMVSDPRYRATGFGVLNFFSCGVGGLTIYAGGALRDANVNVRHMFEFSAVGLLICAILLSFIRSRPAEPT